MTTNVLVNGEAHALDAADGDATLDLLVDQLGYERRGLAVAVNGEVVPRSTWSRRRLSDGDQVEILTIAQGG
jgi:sulfur carrier protein